MKRYFPVAVLFLSAVLPLKALADNLPESPAPKIEGTALYQNGSRLEVVYESFWNSKVIKVETASMFALGVWDLAQTCNFLRNGRREQNLTQSCPANAALTLGVFDGGALALSYVLHRMHHDRLSKLPMLYMIGTSAEGVIISKERRGW